MARTRVQRVRATCTFATILQRFMLRGRFPFPLLDLYSFYAVLLSAGKEPLRIPH